MANNVHAAQVDRFIPVRSGLDVDLANYKLMKENDQTASPSQATPGKVSVNCKVRLSITLAAPSCEQQCLISLIYGESGDKSSAHKILTWAINFCISKQSYSKI